MQASPDDFRRVAREASRLGAPEASAALFRRALAIWPEHPGLRLDLILVTAELGDPDVLGRECRILLEQVPDHALGHNLLGVALRQQGRFEEAASAFERASALEPQNIAPLINCAKMRLDQRDPKAAMALFERAQELAPKEPAAVIGQARACLQSGDPASAALRLEAALALKPDHAEALKLLVAVLFEQKRFEEAAVIADRSIAAEPHDEMRVNRARIDRALGRFDAAIAIYREILVRRPDHLEALIGLGLIYVFDLPDYRLGAELLERALVVDPGNVMAAGHLIVCLSVSREGGEERNIERALQLARDVLARGGDVRSAAFNLQLILGRMADMDGMDQLGNRAALREYFLQTDNLSAIHLEMVQVKTLEDRHALIALHRAWGDRMVARAARAPIARPSIQPRAAKIRIGLMSADLRDHPVSYFALPIFEHYDRERFELYAYSFYPRQPDRIQTQMSKLADQFRVIVGGTDHEVAQTIAEDGPDILFELGGATQFNRLGVMAYRPAPVQVSWLGYPHSAGLPTIDYILVDPYLKPEDPALLIEKPFQMSQSWVCLAEFGFQPVPIAEEAAEARFGHITFGSMNNPNKYTRAQIALWAEVMTRVPDSRFLFVRPESASGRFRENIVREFGRNGVAPNRLLFLGNQRGRHNECYNLIDICLDTAPQTGGTTTCESIWMGCPVVTLVGPAFFERLSYSNLTNAGLGDLCAHDRESFLDIAVELAADRARRSHLRQTLRSQIMESPLGRTKNWVADFEREVIRTLS
jgi:protein O-GlcNAc transferase